MLTNPLGSVMALAEMLEHTAGMTDEELKADTDRLAAEVESMMPGANLLASATARAMVNLIEAGVVKWEDAPIIVSEISQIWKGMVLEQQGRAQNNQQMTLE